MQWKGKITGRDPPENLLNPERKYRPGLSDK